MVGLAFRPSMSTRSGAALRRMGGMFPFLVVAALTAFHLRHNEGYAVDDSFITFRYAQNALEGHGLVFNAGERYYGSTAMGYAALLAAIAEVLSMFSFRVGVHQIATFLSALSMASVSAICARALLDVAGGSIT